MSGIIRVGFCAAILFGVASMAHAQTGRPERPWSVDFGIGWDNGISGNINSSAIGTLNDQAVVILKNKYEDVYGTGRLPHRNEGPLLAHFRWHMAEAAVAVDVS